MKKLFVLATVLISPLVACAEVSSFVFTSTNTLDSSGRNTISIQAQNSSGEKENTTQTGCLEVKTTSASGNFFASSNSIDPVSVLVLTINKNSANRNFYYEDSSDGSYVFSLKIAYRPDGESCSSDWATKGWAPSWIASQSYKVGDGGVENNPPIESNPPPTQTTNETGNTTTFPVDQRVFAEITLNTKSLIAGAQFFISGEGYGLEKKPLANARFLWNFGDGTVKSGQSVAHTYKNPGDYLIVLDVSSEKFSGTARQLVSAIKSPLSISITKNDDGNLVKISNDASVELDLSGWFIESQDGRFTIPLHTIVLPKKYLIFDPEVLGFNIGTKVSLLYPTGSVADANEGVIPASKIITTTAQLPKAPVSNPVKVVPNKNDINQEILTSNQVGSVISATDGALTDEKIRDDADQGSSAGWIFAFIALLGIATGSVFLIKRPVYNQADEFTIEE